MTESFKKDMLGSAEGLGIMLDETKLEQLYIYFERLVEKNRVMNLTGIVEEHEVVVKHFADSLSIVKICDQDVLNGKLVHDKAVKNKHDAYHVDQDSDHCENSVLDHCENVCNADPFLNGVSLIDVGTGAGFPGMVLKIAFPGLSVTLFDSLNKRLIFLNEVIEELGLKDIKTVHGRAEDYGHNKAFRETYDLAVSRAVANLSTLSEYCLPFVRTGGSFIAYKGSGCEEEIKAAAGAIKKLGAEIDRIENFVLPGTDMGRCLIDVRKRSATPHKYPRKAGLPGSDPLR